MDATLTVATLAQVNEEVEFMNAILDALQAGTIEPVIVLSDEDVEELQAEMVGQHYGQNPFLY